MPSHFRAQPPSPAQRFRRTAIRRTTILALACAFVPSCAMGWGPHPQITRVAQAALPEREKAAVYFGAEWDKFAEYCLMGDRFGTVRDDFYPTDFLIFPQAARRFDHLVPDVRNTYEPFFRRSLQALRTESAVNAARWIGSLMHFVQDTGSPSHAAGIKGEMHSRMEGWLDGKAISIAGYSPRLLGSDDDSAFHAFRQRMEELIAFSSKRAEQLRAQLSGRQTRENLPLSLECANETARVCADVLHTLFALALDTPREPSLAGRVRWPAEAPLPRHPARVILLGTNFSTLTGEDGTWEFRNLPLTGKTVAIERCGTRTYIGVQTTMALQATEPTGNLVRNHDFALRWSNPQFPEHWAPIAPMHKLRGYESANIRVSPDSVYRLGASGTRKGTRIGVRWRPHHAITSFANVVWPEGQVLGEVTAPADANYAQVLVVTDVGLADALAQVWLLPAPSTEP